MRKMFSQKQIIDLIKNAILNGDIVIPEELPDVSTATAGQILALNADKEPEWVDAPEELPATASASAGQMLALDSDKHPQWTNVPEELPDQTGASQGDVLKIGADGLEWGSAGGGGIDTDVTVEIETTASDDYANRTNYAEPITLQEFIANCEAGNVYTEGTIAKVTNLLSETTMRLILIGTNHEVLAYNDTEVAKTTWQFLDMPEHNVRLGLPFNVIDWVQGSGRAYLKQYLDGTNTAEMQLYPSNMDGLISAQGLLQVCHIVYESLPDTLKRHIKTVRRYYNRKRNNMSVGANGGTESNSSQMCQLACNVFHLAGTDLGTSGASGEGSGSKYNYFTGNARRIRFYNGSAASWWTASPGTPSSYRWCTVDSDGYDYFNYTDGNDGVAPAFCI